MQLHVQAGRWLLRQSRSVLVAMLCLLLAQAATAQTLKKGPLSQNSVSFTDMTARLEQTANRTAQAAPKGAARGAAVDFAWPSSAEEYRALNKHVLVLVSVVTQDAAELPLRRVYATIDGRETELTRLSSQRSGVRKGSVTFSMLGPYREDGFYLAPAGAMMAEGYLQADFATRRNNFNLYKLPGNAPAHVRSDGNSLSAPDAKPDNAAVKAMLQREYKGFELPPGLR